MTPHDLQNLIDKLETKLARQKAALASTTTEANLVEASASLAEPTRRRLLDQLAARKLRQWSAVDATEGYLKVLRSTTGVKKGA